MMQLTDRVDDSQTGECGSHFGLTERVGLVLIKVPEGTLELFQLGRS
jgi:hypothetical protein